MSGKAWFVIGVAAAVAALLALAGVAYAAGYVELSFGLGGIGVAVAGSAARTKKAVSQAQDAVDQVDETRAELEKSPLSKQVLELEAEVTESSNHIQDMTPSEKLVLLKDLQNKKGGR